MRDHLDTLALIGVTLAACANAPLARPPAPPVDWASFRPVSSSAAPQRAPTNHERDVADAYQAALMTPHFVKLTSCLAEDVSVSFSGSNRVSGRDAAVRLHELLFGAFDDRAFVTHRVFRTADIQVVEWTMTGRQARDWMGVTPTGRPVDFNGVTLLWTKDEGTITEAHVYFDLAAVKGQLGAGPRQLVELPFPAPVAAQEPLEQLGTPVEMANVALVRAQLDALEAHDEPSYLASMADDVEVRGPELAGPTRGTAAAKAYYRSLDHAIRELDTTVRNIWGIATFVVVEYSIGGVQLAPLGWVPSAPDRVVGLHVVDVDEVRGGRIERIWRYDNPEELAEARADFEGLEVGR